MLTACVALEAEGSQEAHGQNAEKSVVMFVALAVPMFVTTGT